MTSYGQTDVQDVLEWMPAGIEPAAQPTATGGRSTHARFACPDVCCGLLLGLCQDPASHGVGRSSAPRQPPRVVLAGSDGISAALVAWGDLCTRQSNIPLDRSGLRFGSLLTLLHLVAGAARRVQPLLPPGELAAGRIFACGSGRQADC